MTTYLQETPTLYQPLTHQPYLPVPINLHTLTRITAYFQKRAVKCLDGVKLINRTHTRAILKLCYPIHFQLQNITIWHQDLNLFHALCLLLAAGLLEDHGPTIIPSPLLSQWLSADEEQRQIQLQNAVESGAFRQQLIRLTPISCPIKPKHPRKLIFPVFPNGPAAHECRSDSFQIYGHNYSGLEDWQWFDLYQIGRFECESQQFYITRDSIMQATKAGFSQNHIKWLLQTATGRSISSSDESQLSQWIDQSDKYRFQHTVLLSVRSPKDLEPIFKNKKLRQAVIQQLSPRHIAVRHDAVAQLQKELGDVDGVKQPAEPDSCPESAAAWSWLGVRLLAGLRQYVPTAPAPSGALIDQLTGQLTLQAHTDLEATAQSIIKNLGRTIQGKDRFFPAESNPPTEWEHTIEKAIEKENSIQLTYQSLGDVAPRRRTVWPHRIWHRSKLVYFSGWCDLAGTDLTFRLDRAREVFSRQ